MAVDYNNSLHLLWARPCFKRYKDLSHSHKSPDRYYYLHFTGEETEEQELIIDMKIVFKVLKC